MTEPDSRWDDEGITDVADDATPERTRIPEPQEAALPAERPTAAADFGRTADEQITGEPLDQRFARERPDIQPDTEPHPQPDPRPAQAPDESPDDSGPDPDDPTQGMPDRLVEPDEGAHPDTEKDLLAVQAQGEAGL
jgi:hypothetical protein